MKKEFLKAAGIRNEQEFLEKYPTEAAFFEAYPDMQKYAKGTAGINTLGSNPMPKPEDIRRAAWDKFLSGPGVRDKVIQLAKKYKWAPETLMSVMETETGGTFNPRLVSKSGYTGLFQFGSKAAKEAGTTVEALKKMNALQQLDAADKMFSRWGGADHPYDLISLPGKRKAPVDRVLYANTSPIAKQNPKWQDEKGNVTRAAIHKAAVPFPGYMVDPNANVWENPQSPQKDPVLTDLNKQTMGGIPKYEKGTQGIETEEEPKQKRKRITLEQRRERWDKFLAQPGVKDAILDIAEEHKWAPERLMSIIEIETGGTFDPAQKGKGSATGLIQILEDTAKRMGTTTADIAKMSAAEQLRGPIAKYFAMNANGAKDPYIVVAAPAYGHVTGDTEIYKQGTRKHRSNPAWVGPDGRITADSVAAAAKDFPDYSVYKVEGTPADTTATKTTPRQAPAQPQVRTQPAKPKAKVLTPEEIKYNAFDKRMREDTRYRGMYNIADKEGREAAMNGVMAGLTANGGVLNPVNRMVEEYTNISGRLSNMLNPNKKQINYQQVGYTNKKVKKDMEGFLNYLKHDANVTSGVMDAFRTIGAVQGKALTGQDIEGAIPNAIAEILSGESAENINKWIAGAKKKGVLDEKSDWIVRDVVKNPENYWTKQMTANTAIDVAMLMKNPRALINAVKVPGKILKLGGKSVAQVFSALKDVKGGKAVIAKLAKSVVAGVSDSYRFTGKESLDELAEIGKKLDAAGVPTNGSRTWAQSFRDTGSAIAKLPGSVRKTLTGASFAEIRETERSLQELLGASPSEIRTMSREQVGSIIGTKLEGIRTTLENATKAKAEGIANFTQSKEALIAARAELKAAQQSRVPGDITRATEKVSRATASLDKAKSGLAKALSKEELYNTNWDQISKFERLSGTPEFATKWRDLVRFEAANAKHLKNLEKLGDVPEEVRKYNKFTDAATSTRAKAVQELFAAGDKEVAVMNAKEKALELARASKGFASGVQKSEEEINAAKAAMKKLEETPELMRLLDKDINALRNMKDVTKAAYRAANILRAYRADNDLIDEVFPQAKEQPVKEATPPAEADAAANGSEPYDTSGYDDDKAAEAKAAGVGATPEATPTDESVAMTGAEEPAPKPRLIDTLSEGLGTLASYAPAIYNIAKGMEPVEKVSRRFVTPRLRTYENMSQPQINAIDDAFVSAIEGARNLSGGMASNFRSNVEAAWADKIKRTAMVNMEENARAQAVKDANLDALTKADYYNQQVDQQADVQDMQSKAVKNAFMAQGMSDLQNIASRNLLDKRRAESQEFAKELMVSGTDFMWDGNKLVPRASYAPASTASASAPATTTPKGKNVIDKAAISNFFAQSTDPNLLNTDEYYQS